ncbi:MAG TPA: hypothetical protein VI612_03420 [Candidatus Nanoarchaeia archaeon]|nr:hypothetical protein [Candidatus Nanoarchaeia archaeon]
MKILHHTVGHIFVHAAMFTGCALLIPVATSALDGNSSWASSSFIGGVLLILVSGFFLYRIKESTSGLLQGLGGMMFLPGALNVLLSVLNIESLFDSANIITGMAFIEPVTKYYISHSVPSVLSVAAVYMAIGGTLYWVGTKLDNFQSKLPWNN